MSISVSLDVQARVAQHAARRTAATGRVVSVQQAIRELATFGLVAAEKCLSCSMSLPCSTHGPEDTEADDPPLPGFQSVVDLYHDEFVRTRGEKPKFTVADFAAFKRLIQAIGGADEAKKLIRKAFSLPFAAATITIQSLARNPQLAQGKPVNGHQVQSPQQARSNWQPPEKKTR